MLLDKLFEQTHDRTCYFCGKWFTATHSTNSYCSNDCKNEYRRLRDQERRAELAHRKRYIFERKNRNIELPVPDYVKAAWEILLKEKDAGVGTYSLMAKVKARGIKCSSNYIESMDEYGYLVYEDDNGRIFPYEIKGR